MKQTASLRHFLTQETVLTLNT